MKKTLIRKETEEKEKNFEGFEDGAWRWDFPTEIDNWVSVLSGAEFKCLWYILRHTCGWQKTEDSISLTQFERGIFIRSQNRWLDRGTGLSRQGILNALKKLIEKGFIKKVKVTSEDGKSEVNRYKVVQKQRPSNNLKEISPGDEGGLRPPKCNAGGLRPPKRSVGGVVKKFDHGSPKNEPEVVKKFDYGSQKNRRGVVKKVDTQYIAIETNPDLTKKRLNDVSQCLEARKELAGKDFNIKAPESEGEGDEGVAGVGVQGGPRPPKCSVGGREEGIVDEAIEWADARESKGFYKKIIKELGEGIFLEELGEARYQARKGVVVSRARYLGALLSKRWQEYEEAIKGG